MPFYPVMPPDVTSSGAEGAAPGLPGLAGMVAVRAADLASPCRRGLGRDGRTAVTAAGHPADHARLGVAGQRLDELTGRPGVIDEIARSVTLDGRVKGAARRAMSPALAIRFTADDPDPGRRLRRGA